MSCVPLAVGLSNVGALSFWSRIVITSVTEAFKLPLVAVTSRAITCGAGRNYKQLKWFWLW